VALAVNNRGMIVGAMLVNAVNLCDVEGRSALLLGRAKDNNASCALGPFIRLFDSSFSLDDVRETEFNLRVEGADGYALQGQSLMREISRDPEDLVAQAIGANYQYPDGLVLLTGTMFAPVEDRGKAGEGFTHHEGDVVSISSAKLGTLVNTVAHCDKAPPWEFGLTALMRNLAQRGLLN
jgi:fumarylacetoacetate (FAA) hydrolase family protein